MHCEALWLPRRISHQIKTLSRAHQKLLILQIFKAATLERQANYVRIKLNSHVVRETIR